MIRTYSMGPPHDGLPRVWLSHSFLGFNFAPPGGLSLIFFEFGWTSPPGPGSVTRTPRGRLPGPPLPPLRGRLPGPLAATSAAVIQPATGAGGDAQRLSPLAAAGRVNYISPTFTFLHSRLSQGQPASVHSAP